MIKCYSLAIFRCQTFVLPLRWASLVPVLPRHAQRAQKYKEGTDILPAHATHEQAELRSCKPTGFRCWRISGPCTGASVGLLGLLEAETRLLVGRCVWKWTVPVGKRRPWRPLRIQGGGVVVGKNGGIWREQAWPKIISRLRSTNGSSVIAYFLTLELPCLRPPSCCR